MKIKIIVSFLLIFVIFSFVAATFSSFILPGDIIVKLDAESFMAFFQENWSIIALIISEVAALLPSKQKGILQTFVFILNKVMESYYVKRKILRP